MTAPLIQTERLTLRPHQIEDFAPYAALWLSDQSKYMGGPLEDKDEAWGVFCAEMASWDLQGFGYWALERNSDNAHIGAAGLGMPPSFPEREMGWLLYPNFRGQGYASEAGAAVKTYAFGTLGWDTLVSYISPANAASIAVSKRLGGKHDPSATAPAPEDHVYRYAPEALQ